MTDESDFKIWVASGSDQSATNRSERAGKSVFYSMAGTSRLGDLAERLTVQDPPEKIHLVVSRLRVGKEEIMRLELDAAILDSSGLTRSEMRGGSHQHWRRTALNRTPDVPGTIPELAGSTSLLLERRRAGPEVLA